jgi:dTDP-4-dehydrorhamnose reductase
LAVRCDADFIRKRFKISLVEIRQRGHAPLKIILFGKNGQVGSEIVALFKSQKIELYAFDSKAGDITDSKKISEIISSHHDADFVINAAAYTAVDKAEDEPEKAYAVNRDGVENLACACKENDIPLFHLSTDYVFDGEAKQPYSENDLPNPIGVYAKSKYAGEEILKNTWGKNIILRVSWVFGENGNNFVKTMLRLAKEKKSLNIVNDQFGCPTAAKDIARVILEIIKQNKQSCGIYHYCGKPQTTWYQFAKKIMECAGIKNIKINPITTEQFPTKAVRPKYSVLSVEKIGKEFNIQQQDWESYLPRIMT